MHVTVQSIYIYDWAGEKYMKILGVGWLKRKKRENNCSCKYKLRHVSLISCKSSYVICRKTKLFEPENVDLLSAVSLWEQCHTLSKEQLWLHEISHIPKFTCHFLYHNKEFLYRIPFTCIMINVNRRPKQREIFRNKDHFFTVLTM